MRGGRAKFGADAGQITGNVLKQGPRGFNSDVPSLRIQNAEKVRQVRCQQGFAPGDDDMARGKVANGIHNGCGRYFVSLGLPRCIGVSQKVQRKLQPEVRTNAEGTPVRSPSPWIE